MKLIALFLGILFSFVLLAQNPPELKQAEICFDTTALDFGKIEYNSPGKFTFYFTNCGEAPLIISTGMTSCGCLVCTWPKEPILTGERKKIELKYDTKRVGRTIKTATIISNAANNPTVILKIKGEVLPPQKAFFADSSIDFGSVKAGQKFHFELTNRENSRNSLQEDTLKILKIEHNSGVKLELIPTKTSLETAESVKLEFIIPEKVKKGTFNSEWKIYFNDGREPVLLKATWKLDS